ncbi:MAG TPA: CRTAC1 family protein [Terriglobales bacterium]|nr:CRTAC1 family protein [Terriglobales bacterium]
MRLLCVLLAAATATAQTAAPPVPQFQDIAREAGLNVPNISTKDEYYIVESMSGGAGFIDCDNDGKLDIVTVNGSTIDRYRQGADLMVTLYHQDANLKFTDITQSAGLTRKGWGMGVSVADFDNDGWQDLYVTGYGGNVLYRNLGNCKFEDVTEKAGLRVGGFSSGAAWGDYDRDGNIDLFVARYTHQDLNNLPDTHADGVPCAYMGLRVYCGPSGLTGETDFLFHNRGGGTFEDVSKKAGVDNENHYFGMQAVWADFSNDGWPDLYVANDVNPNYFFRNRHDGTFEEIGLLNGTAVNSDGRMQGSMGVDVGDFDHDGLLDIIVTNYIQEGVDLYWNRGEMGFDQISGSAGLLKATRRYVGWGTALFDMDNDGWPDILVTNGHIYPQVDQVNGDVGFRAPLLLFRNRRDRTFEDVTELSNINRGPLYIRRGAAFGDVNNDGKVDVLILNHNDKPSLLINRTQTDNHAALFRLIGTRSNKAAIGARVTVTAGGMTQFMQVKSGSSYLSQNDLRLHFGLGPSTVMEKVEVSWPSGAKELFNNLPADFIYTLTEGNGVQTKKAFNP